MRKSIAVFGGSLFQDIRYENGEFIPTPMQSVIQLSKEYKIDNYSVMGLKMERATRLIKSLPMKGNYSDCILALGEEDLEDPLSFKKDLVESIEYLKSNDIRPLLVSLPKDMMQNKNGFQIQDILDQIAVEKNVDYIYEGETSKLVSYIILDHNDLPSAILNLC